MDQKDFERLISGERFKNQAGSMTAEPLGRESYRSESALSGTVAMTPEEKAMDIRTNQNPAVFEELEREYRNAKDPKVKAILGEEIQRQLSQKSGLPAIGGLGLQGAGGAGLVGPAFPSDSRTLPDFAGEKSRRDAQAASDESPISTSLGRGWERTKQMAGDTFNLLTGDAEGIRQAALDWQKYDEANPQPTSAKEFSEGHQAAGDSVGAMLKNAAGNLGGLGLSSVEQITNSIPSMAGSIAGSAVGAAKGFAVGGPLGALAGSMVGGIIGATPGSMMIEPGAKVAEAMAESGVDLANPDAVKSWFSANQGELIEKGLLKAGGVAAVDGLMGGIGQAIVAKPALAFAAAQNRALAKIGVNAGDKAAVAAARQLPEYRALMAQPARDFLEATTVAKNAMRGTASFAAETLGEGTGEYWGEYLAEGEGSFNEAMLESLTAGITSVATTGAQYGASKVLFGPDQTVEEIKALAAIQSQEQKPAAPQPNSPLSNAAEAAKPVDPFAEMLAPITERLNDREIYGKIRGNEALGPDALGDILASYRVATNKNADPMQRQAAIDRLGEFFRAFDNMPNFTQGAPESSGQSSGLPVVAPTQGSGVGFVDPAAGSIDGEARTVADPLSLGGQPRLPAPPRRLPSPPPALIADSREAQRIVAEYEAAYQDLVKADQLGASDQELMQRQINLRNAEARLSELNQFIESRRQQETAIKRDALLSDVLATLQPWQNPLRAFDRALKQSGFTDTNFTEAEKAKIARFMDIAAAQDEQQAIPSAPNEAGDFGIPEKVVSRTPATNAVANMLNAGWQWDGGWNLVSPTGERYNLKAAERQFLKAQAAKTRVRKPIVSPSQQEQANDAALDEGSNQGQRADDAGGQGIARPGGIVPGGLLRGAATPAQRGGADSALGNANTNGLGALNGLPATQQVAEEAPQANDAQAGDEQGAAQTGEVANAQPTSLPNQGATQAQPPAQATVVPAAVASQGAEQKIRQAFESEQVSIGVAKPITVEHNGVMQRFIARQDRVNSSGKSKSVIHLSRIKRGRMLAGDDVQWIRENYKLTGSDQLVEEGLPTVVSNEEAQRFNAMFDPSPVVDQATPAERAPAKPLSQWTAEEIQARLDRGNLSPESEQKLRDLLATKPKPKATKPEAQISIGNAPGDAQPVTVRNGVIYIGEEPAIDYDTEQDVTIQEGATPQQIVDALKASGVIGRRKVFGLKDVANAEARPESVAAPAQQETDPVAVVAEAESAGDAELAGHVANDDDAQEGAASPGEYAAYVDEKVSEYLAKFEQGDFSLPSNVTAAGKESRELANEMNVQNALAYALAAKKFIEGDLSAKVPGAKSPTITLEFLEGLRPKLIEKKIAKAKDLPAILKAIDSIASDDKDVRYYLRGIHFDPEGMLVATDGHRIAVVSDVDTSSIAKSDKGFTILGRDGKWIDGKFPDWRRVIPEASGVRETFNATQLGNIARGIVKAMRYTVGPTSASEVPMIINIDGVEYPFAAQYIADMADLFRKMGYETFEISGTDIAGKNKSIIAESPDRRVRQRVMGKEVNFHPFARVGSSGFVGESAVTHPDYGRYVESKAQAASKPETKAEPTQEAIQASPKDQGAAAFSEGKERKAPESFSAADKARWFAGYDEAAKDSVHQQKKAAIDKYSLPPSTVILQQDDGRWYAHDENTYGSLASSIDGAAKALSDMFAFKKKEAEKAAERELRDKAMDLAAIKVKRGEKLSVDDIDAMFPRRYGQNDKFTSIFPIGGSTSLFLNKLVDNPSDVEKVFGKFIFDMSIGTLAMQKSINLGIVHEAFLPSAGNAPNKAKSDANRGEVGASLTKAERQAVLKTLVDVYKQNRAPKEFKGLDSNGNERYGYAHSPEYFMRSDITGAMVRYYVTLPDGRIAHPTELFADYTQSDIDAEIQRQVGEEKASEEGKAWRNQQIDSIANQSLQKVRAFRGEQFRKVGKAIPDRLVEFYSEDEGKWFAVEDREVAKVYRSELRERGYREVATYRDESGENQPAVWMPKSYVEDSDVAAEAKREEFAHNGVRIYPVRVNVGGVAQDMWGIESFENKAKREAGERHGFGDALVDTEKQAKEAADRLIRDERERAEYQAGVREREAEAARKKAAIEADTFNGFLDDKAPNVKALIRERLAKQWRFDGDKVMTARERIESLWKAGELSVSTYEENKIKPMSRAQFNRATQREQDAHDKKVREGGKVTVYQVNGSDLGKTAYDYAQHLLAAKQPEIDFKARLKKYNDTLQAELDRGVSIDAAHQQALGIARLTGDGLLKARSMLGLPATSRPGTWWIEESGESKKGEEPDSWMKEIFGDGANAAPAAAQTKRSIDMAGLVKSLRDFSQQKLAEANDWASRQYKQNNTQINLDGDGPTRNESMSVSAANESRRRRNVESLQQQAQFASNLANRIENGRNVQAEVEQAIRNADNDIARDGKPRFGGTRESQIEAYISNSMLGDANYGYGDGTVASVIRKAYDQGTPAGSEKREELQARIEAAEQQTNHDATPAQKDAELAKRITIAADSIDKLRKVDVERVLTQGNLDRAAMADYIKRNRPDLAEEVDDVLNDGSDSQAQQGSGAAQESDVNSRSNNSLRKKEKNILDRKSDKFWKGETWREIAPKVIADPDVRLRKEPRFSGNTLGVPLTEYDYYLTDGRIRQKIDKEVADYIESLRNVGSPRVNVENAKESAQSDQLKKRIADAEQRTAVNPTEAQKESGNYVKGKFPWKGMTVAIETPKNAERSGVDENGESWKVTAPVSYGYFLGTKGADKDHVDVFMGDSPESDLVFVVNQNKVDSQSFDEHKVMAGFASAKDARDAYLGSFEGGFGSRVLGSISGPYSIKSFREMLDAGAFSKAKPIGEAISPLSFVDVEVSGEQKPASVAVQEIDDQLSLAKQLLECVLS